MQGSDLAKRIQINVTNRLRVLRIVMTRRVIWSDLAEIVAPHHIIREVYGNINPLKFCAALPVARAPMPNFAEIVDRANEFERAGTPKWNSEPSVSEFLGGLVFRLQARTVVELGCFIGWTSAHLALGLRAAGTGELWCVDAEQRFVEEARMNLRRLGLGHSATFLCGKSTDGKILERLPTEIDVIFIDTSHLYESTREEIAAYIPRLRPGGYMILHDTISFPGVRHAVAEVWDQFDTLTFATERGDGLTILGQKKVS
jgi:predicted O-methyltransferase YrrM